LDSKYGLVKTVFDAWKKKHWGNASNPNGAFDADPDGDGIKNGLEFIFGLDPKVSGKLGIHQFRFNGRKLTVNWMKPAASGLTYEIQENNTLRNTNGWIVLQNLNRHNVSETNHFEKVEFTKPSGWLDGGENKKFIRIRVIKP
jgi:hypothetical protein